MYTYKCKLARAKTASLVADVKRHHQAAVRKHKMTRICEIGIFEMGVCMWTCIDRLPAHTDNCTHELAVCSLDPEY